MFSLKNWLIFLSGAVFFHAFGHMMMPYMFDFPVETKMITLTAMINLWAIMGSIVLGTAMLWLAKKV
jgi:hypothetical protein